MPAPAQDVTRNRAWQLSVAGVVLAIGFAFHGAVAQLAELWVSEADYSHGLLVLPFCGYLLWARRGLFPDKVRWPDWWGAPFYAAALVAYFAEERFNFAKEWVQAAALLAALAGVVVMFCGRWRGLRWAWPALALLPLTFKLPWLVESRLTWRLRGIATDGANFGFQTVGVPSYTEGNVIHAGDATLGVEQACSGLSMLLAFVSFAAAIALVYKSRPVIDRAIVLVSSVPIAILCNVLRVIATGLVYDAGWTSVGNAFVHDFAGWLMMPFALGLMWLLLKAIDWVTEPVERVSTTDALGLPRKRAGAGPLPGPA